MPSRLTQQAAANELSSNSWKRGIESGSQEAMRFFPEKLKFGNDGRRIWKRGSPEVFPGFMVS